MQKHRTYISFDPEQVPKVDVIAKKMGGLNRSNIVRLALQKLIDEFEKEHGAIETK